MDSLPTTKVCSKCSQEKPLAEFYRSKRGKFGRKSECKTCVRRYNAENAEAQRAYQKRYTLKRQETKRVYDKQYYRENAEEKRQAAKRWYEDNLDRVKLAQKRWYEENGEAVREHRREEFQRNPGPIRDRERAKRAERFGAEGSFTDAEFQAKLELYKGRCHWCGEVIEGQIDSDHLIALANGGSNDISNVVPSCKSCNSSKRNRWPWEFQEGRLL